MMEKRTVKVKTETVECPICLNVPRNTKIFLCRNSHSICCKCLDQCERKECPTCRVPFDNSPSRNRTMEELIENNFEFPCKHAENDCQFRGIESILKVHESNCPYRNFLCPIQTCLEVLSFKEMKTHFDEYHVYCKYMMEGCGYTGVLAATNLHSKSCPFSDITCTYEGCSKKLKRTHLFRHIKKVHCCQNRGCEFQGNKDCLAEHAVVCQLRKVPCPDYKCKEYVQARMIVGHIMDKHEEALDWNTSLTSTFESIWEWDKENPASDYCLRLVYNQKQTFIMQFRKLVSDNKYCSWVALVGDSTDTEKYEVEIKMEANGITMKKKTKVWPIDAKVEEIMKEESSFTYKKEIFDEVCSKDEDDEYVLDITYFVKEKNSKW